MIDTTSFMLGNLRVCVYYLCMHVHVLAYVCMCVYIYVVFLYTCICLGIVFQNVHV